MNSRAVKIAVSLLLTVSLLCCSVSVFADDVQPTNTPYPGTEDHPLMVRNFDEIAFIVWQLLESWGIKITYQDISSYTSDVEELIINWIWEFLDEQPSIETIYAWVLDWWFGTDFWGNLVVNDTLLEDVEAFAGWLERKYGLIDNDNLVINPKYAVNGVTLFNLNTYYQAVNKSDLLPNSNWFAIKVDTDEQNNSNNGVLGFFFVHTHINTYECFFISYSNGNYVATQYGLTYETVEEWAGQVNVSNWTLNVNNYYYGFSSFHPNMILAGDYFQSKSWNDELQFLNNLQVENIGDYKVVTAEIEFPVENPNYSPGDGMTIVDGQPDYGQVTIPDSISVNNLPAIVSTGTIENPEVDQIYTNIPAFFQMAGDTMNGFKQILFRMPDEVLICLYAVLSIGVIFGFLRIMREH